MTPETQRPRHGSDGERKKANNYLKSTNPHLLDADLQAAGRMAHAGGPDLLAAEFALALLEVALTGGAA